MNYKQVGCWLYSGRWRFANGRQGKRVVLRNYAMKDVARQMGRLMALMLFAMVFASSVPAQTTIYVSTNGGHSSPFSSWTDAATNIHEAVALAVGGDTVRVSNGTYRLTNQISVTSGFTMESENGPGVTTLYRDGGDGYFRILTVSNSGAVVSGFTMTNGLVDGGANVGSCLRLNSGTVSNCVITSNIRWSERGGGGVINISGGLLTGCIISNNAAYYGLIILSGSGIIEDSEVTACNGNDYGIIPMSGGVIRRCRIWNNNGNGSYVRLAGGQLENCLVYSNVTAGPYMGPAAGVYVCGGRMVNCTVTLNTRTGNTSSGVKRDSGVITNCIIYGNGIGNPGDDYFGDVSACWYSCAQELTNSAQGNTIMNPKFIDAASADFRLDLGSASLDTGTNLTSITTDIDGRTRPQAADSRGTLRHDMGAYEKDGTAGALDVGFSGTPISGLNSVTSVLTAAVSGTNTTITWWGWDFDNDGSFETNGTDLSVVTNEFGPGRYTVSVRVTNSFDETAAATNASYVLVVTPDIYVSTNGGNTAPYLSWTDAATNLNDAVDVALAGCTVHVSNGNYRITKKIDLYSGIAIRSENGPGVTTVYRHSADPKFGLFDIRHSNALVAGIKMTNGNVSASSGAAIYMTAGTVSNCVIERCLMEAGYGGSITLSGGLMTDCVVTNMAHWYPTVVLSGSVIVDRSLFIENTGGEAGFCQITGNSIVRNSRFMRITGNTPYIWVSGGTLENSLVCSNNAAGAYLGPAGGVRISSGRMVNCTVATSWRTGGTASGVSQTGGVITNCIIYGNGVNAPADNYSGDISACWYSCAPELTNSAQGNTALDPKFFNASSRDLRLKLGSPCLDTGTNLPGITADIDGISRPLASDSGGTLRHDMGVYEKDGAAGALEVGFSGTPLSGMNSVTSVLTAVVAGADTSISWWGWDFDSNGSYETNGSGLAVVTNIFGPGRYTVSVRATNSTLETAVATNSNYVLVVAPDIYVSNTGGHSLPYSSWANAATSLNDAVDIALSGCTIHVTNGSYRIRKKVDIFDGFSVRSVNGPDYTTIWRDTNVAVFGLFDLRHADALLSGFTITNGGVIARSVLYMTAGTVSNCVMTRNDLAQVDRGMLVVSGGTLSRCVMTNNYAFYGLGIFSGSALIQDCRFGNNGAGQYGFIQMSGGTMRRCTIVSNTASYHTGGVTLTGGRLENCLIYTNVAQSTGSANGAGGVVMSGGSLVNCTIAGNVKSSASAPCAGGVVLSGGSITNCIIYGNYGASMISNYNGSAGSCWYSCAPELTHGSQANITNNPVFTGLAGGDLSLAGNSPCINSGTTAGWNVSDIDLAASRRIVGVAVDMGCYEAVTSGCVFMFK